ncbi:MAG: aminoglycoside phosphotransferase family protein [Pseudomonadota bacterium]
MNEQDLGWLQLRLPVCTVNLEPIATVRGEGWRIRTPDGDYAFIRRTCAPWLTPQFEVAAQRAAAAVGLAPELVDCDLNERLLLMHWIDGEPADTPHLEAMAHTLASIHRLQLPDSLDVRRGVAELAQVYADIIDQPSRCGPLLDEVHAYREDDDWVVCHRDPTPSNFLLRQPQSTAVLLDWEYASHGDRWFDVACVLESFEWSAEEQQQFIDHYARHAGVVANAAHLRRARMAYAAIVRLWDVAVDLVR